MSDTTSRRDAIARADITEALSTQSTHSVRLPEGIDIRLLTARNPTGPDDNVGSKKSSESDELGGETA